MRLRINANIFLFDREAVGIVWKGETSFPKVKNDPGGVVVGELRRGTDF
jgi:hypothetical protein